mgnify:FL=1
MMMFGGPSHRLQSQIQSAARVLDIKLSFLYLPDFAMISFEDPASATSHIKLIRQPSALNIAKLTEAYQLYWEVRQASLGSLLIALRRVNNADSRSFMITSPCQTRQKTWIF